MSEPHECTNELEDTFCTKCVEQCESELSALKVRCETQDKLLSDEQSAKFIAQDRVRQLEARCEDAEKDREEAWDQLAYYGHDKATIEYGVKLKEQIKQLESDLAAANVSYANVWNLWVDAKNETSGIKRELSETQAKLEEARKEIDRWKSDHSAQYSQRAELAWKLEAQEKVIERASKILKIGLEIPGYQNFKAEIKAFLGEIGAEKKQSGKEGE